MPLRVVGDTRQKAAEFTLVVTVHYDCCQSGFPNFSKSSKKLRKNGRVNVLLYHQFALKTSLGQLPTNDNRGVPQLPY